MLLAHGFDACGKIKSMAEQKKSKRNQSLLEALTAFKGMLQASNNIVPGVVLVSLILSGWLISVTLTSGAPLIGVAALAVFIVSIIVYAKTNSYGEASLALIGGLLTVFSVDWTPAYFWIFIGVLTAFSFTALMLSSIKLAAELESIYMQTAIFLTNDPDEIDVIRKRLEEIGKASTPYGQLQMTQRAEAIRLLIFRKIPIDSLSGALAAIEIFTTMTKVDHKTVTLFIADMTKAFEARPGSEYDAIVHRMLRTVREIAVPPEDFIKAFQNSRRLILSESVDPDRYFQELEEHLEAGVAPEEMFNALRERLGNE